MNPLPESEVIDVFEAKATALVNRSQIELEALLHPDFVYVNAGGHLFDKAGYVELVCSEGGLRFVSQTFQLLKFVGLGDSAIGFFDLDDEYEFGGEVYGGAHRSSCVFARSKGKLLWTAGHTMKLE